MLMMLSFGPFGLVRRVADAHHAEPEGHLHSCAGQLMLMMLSLLAGQLMLMMLSLRAIFTRAPGRCS